MVAQQLTPELTQPNVLVEIDPGPTMGPYQETQRCVPERYLSDFMSITSNASVSTSTFGPAVVARRPESSVGYDATALTKMQSHGTKVEVLDGGSVGNSGYLITWQQPVWAHCSKPELTILDTAEEASFIGMNLKRSIEAYNKQIVEHSAFAELPTSCWGLPADNRPLNSFEITQAVVPSLPGHIKDWAKSISSGGCPQRGAAPGRPSSSRDPKTLLFLPHQGGTDSRDCALEDRYRSFDGDSNVDNEVVIYEKKMAGDDKSAVTGKSNITVDIHTGRLQGTQPMGQENTDGVKIPFSMSWCTSAKPNVNHDGRCIASEILVWMIEYNLVSYSAL